MSQRTHQVRDLRLRQFGKQGTPKVRGTCYRGPYRWCQIYVYRRNPTHCKGLPSVCQSLRHTSRSCPCHCHTVNRSRNLPHASSSSEPASEPRRGDERGSRREDGLTTFPLLNGRSRPSRRSSRDVPFLTPKDDGCAAVVAGSRPGEIHFIPQMVWTEGLTD